MRGAGDFFPPMVFSGTLRARLILTQRNRDCYEAY